MMTELKKKILIVLLRYERREISNIFWTTLSKKISIDRRDAGLSSRELAYYITWKKKLHKFKYDRSLNSLANAGLVKESSSERDIYPKKLMVFYLTKKGREEAEDIENEIKEYLIQWRQVLEDEPPIDKSWYKEYPGMKKEWKHYDYLE